MDTGMKQCCVIGGTGFIGSHLVQLLHRHNRHLTVLGRNPHPSRDLPEGIRYMAGNYGDRNFMTAVLEGMDEVISLAYATVPKTSFDNPVHDILENLPAAVNLFQIASSLGIEKLVLVSSGGTVYGRAQKLPIAETHSTHPISPYGITKLAIEKYAMMFYELQRLPVICIRPSNAYGNGQRPFIGLGFVATAIASMLKGRELILFGEPGTIRDYIHVKDVACAISMALERGEPGSCYNVGSGIGKSNRDVLDAIYPYAHSVGIEPRIHVEPLRAFDVPVNVLDCAKIRNGIGWEPAVTFEEGIQETWEWFLKSTREQAIPKRAGKKQLP
jgi:UDP-glucose 4-epimerase